MSRLGTRPSHLHRDRRLGLHRPQVSTPLCSRPRRSAHDPGPVPSPTRPSTPSPSVCDDEDAFYRLDADLFHLAVQPEHRQLDRLLARNQPLWILDEKPMAPPRTPAAATPSSPADRSPCVVLYDFELARPLTARIPRPSSPASAIWKSTRSTSVLE